MFNFKEGYDFSKNVLKFIDFDYPCQNDIPYLIYNNDEYITFDFFIKNQINVLYYDCPLTIPLDRNVVNMMNLKLQEKFYVFKIRKITEVVFIIDNNKVYAITNPKRDGSFNKIEINDYFRLYPISIDFFDSNKEKEKRWNIYYTKGYFLKIIK